MNPLAQTLKDIDPIDGVSAWPLAWGWWGVIVLILLGLSFFAYKLYRIQQYKNSWRYAAVRELEQLRNQLNETAANESAAQQVSEIIRRIAIKIYGREKCAGLVGQEWLRWLKQNDPQNFNWPKEGVSLLTQSYAPAKSATSSKEMVILIDAIKEWVR